MQDKNNPLSLEEIIIIFYAFNKELPEILEEDKRERFKKEIYRYLLKERPQLIERLRLGRVLTEEIQRELDEAFQSFFGTQIG